MGLRTKKREVPKQTAASKTRGTPAFAVLKPVRTSGGDTEAGERSNFWPTGIDYRSVALPQGPLLDDSSDRLEIYELLDD